MKTAVSPLAVLTLLLVATTPALRAEPSAVRIRAEQANQVETTKFTKTQKHSLKIHLTNGSNEALDLKVKYYFFGREMSGGHDIVTVEQGEKPAQLAPLGSVIVETTTAKAVSEEEHYDKKTKVPASGAKLVGYAVQAFQADKLVSEAYEPASLKEQVGKAGAPKVTPAKK